MREWRITEIVHPIWKVAPEKMQASKQRGFQTQSKWRGEVQKQQIGLEHLVRRKKGF